MGRPLIAPRLRRQKFSTTVSPELMQIADEGVERGLWENLGQFMDWIEPLARAELQRQGVQLKALKAKV